MAFFSKSKPVSEELVNQLQPNPEQEDTDAAYRPRRNSMMIVSSEYKASKMINSTDIAFVPLEAVKFRLSQINEEISNIHGRYNNIINDMETTYGTMETEKNEKFSAFLDNWKTKVNSKITEFQDVLAKVLRDKNSLKDFNDRTVKALQTKLRSIQEEKKQILDRINSQMDSFGSSQESEQAQREKSFNIELQELKKEKSEAEEKIKALQDEATKQVAALETVRGNGPDLQAQYLELIHERNEAREKRDATKEAMEKLPDCAEKREAKMLLAELSERADELDGEIDVTLQMAKAQMVPIKLYDEPVVDDLHPNMIQRITMLGNVGNVAEIDRLRNDRDRLQGEVEILRTGKLPGAEGEEDQDPLDSLRSQVGTMEKTLNISNIKIKELQAGIAEQERLKPELDAKRAAQIEKLKTLEEANEQYAKELAAKAEEVEKGQEELNDLKKHTGDTSELKAKLAKSTAILENLKKSNMEQEKELKASLRQRKQLHNQLEDLKGKIRVFCRIRPLNESETTAGERSITTVADEFTINCETKSGQNQPFVCDSIFDVESTQDEIFEDTKSLVQSAIDGFNVSVVAYGTQGSGKTYTMYGDPGNLGIMPRFVNELFRILRRMKTNFSTSVKCHMVELHMDHLGDLSVPQGERASKASLVPVKDPKGVVDVPGVNNQPVDSPDALLSIFQQGIADRRSATASHIVLSVVIDVTNHETHQRTVGKLNLIDLAGAKKIDSESMSGVQMKEARAVNQSMAQLQEMITTLSEGNKQTFRGDKLGRLLSDAFGGNCKTLMFVNTSPVASTNEETLSALNYASRVKLIRNEPTKNVETQEMSKLKNDIMQMAVDLDKHRNALHHCGLAPAKIEQLLDAHFDDSGDEGADFDKAEFDEERQEV